MSTDLFKQVYYNDGQGISQDDLNNAQKFLLSILQDQFLVSLIPLVGISGTAGRRDYEFGGQGATEGDPQDLATIATSRAFCANPGQAFLRQGSADNKVQIAPGTLYQLTDTALTGDTPKFIGYTFTGSEEWAAIANGHATLPRVDLLQMKLEYATDDSASRDIEDATTRIVSTPTVDTTSRVQCTLSVKSGTPATNPVIPDPDTGYCAVGTVYVEALYAVAEGFAFGGADPDSTDGLFLAYIQDQRFPLRIRAYRTQVGEMYPQTAWTITAGLKAAATNATNRLVVPCPAVLGRVMCVAVEQNDSQNLGTQYLCRSSAAAHGALDSISAITTVAFPNGGGIPSVDFTTFEATPDHSGDNKEPVQSTTAKIGVPFWTNGQRCPVEYYKATASSSRKVRRGSLLILNAPNTTEILGVVWFIAEAI